MPKNKDVDRDILPSPESLELDDVPEVEGKPINSIAIRRGKVRELMRMGYNGVEIQKVLAKGVKVGDVTVDTEVDVSTIYEDMEYIRQELVASQDKNILQKRSELLDKLDFLYTRAIREYLNSKGQTKNSFLNTALSVMTKIIEVEGVKSPEKFEASLSSEGRLSNLADQLNKLGENERKYILTAIRTVVKQRQQEGLGESDISNGESRVPAQTPDDEGVSGGPESRSTTG